MRWPNTKDPTSLPDFEMQARQARYRLIADRAIRERIHHLFLGHHQDDQVETILMRLIRNSNDSFLGRQGIPTHNTIPCCEDIRGAQTVERYENFPHWLRRAGARIPREQMKSMDINRGKGVTPSQAGGLQIHRPLLAVPKSEIIDFCLRNGIKYVQDETNHDPTLTMRNAVRHLRNSYALPRALQGPPILELLRWSQSFASSLVARGELAMRHVKVLTFDLRSGRMTVQLSSGFAAYCEDDPEAGAYALARLTGVVSPQSKEDEPTVVPQNNLAEFVGKNRCRTPEQMTMQQALLEKAESDLVASAQLSESGEKEREEIDYRWELHDVRDAVWTLSRPPMRPAERELASRGFAPYMRWKHLASKQAHNPKSKYVADLDKKAWVWSEWMLWDHRYWIRVRASDATRLSMIRIRTYAESDVQKVYEKLGEESSEFKAMLAEAAPGKSRYTIPVLTVEGQVAVFPTLNVMVQKSITKNIKSSLSHHRFLEWEVCFKVLDQPFIKDDVKNIKWRNAQVRKRIQPNAPTEAAYRAAEEERQARKSPKPKDGE